MANVATTSSNLKIALEFVDGDTRTITLKNPKGDLDETDWQNKFYQLENTIKDSNAIIGDKRGGTFGKIAVATIVNQTKTKLDLTPDEQP